MITMIERLRWECYTDPRSGLPILLCWNFGTAVGCYLDPVWLGVAGYVERKMGELIEQQRALSSPGPTC